MDEDKMTTADVAALIGVQAATIRHYAAVGRMPKPDGHLGRTPWWNPDTITTWQTERPGQGAGGGRKPGPRKPRINQRLRAEQAEAEAARLRAELEQIRAGHGHTIHA